MNSTPLTKRQAQVLRAMKAGRSQYATAKALGIRKQRVSQIVARLRQLGELPQERAS